MPTRVSFESSRHELANRSLLAAIHVKIVAPEGPPAPLMLAGKHILYLVETEPEIFRNLLSSKVEEPHFVA
jgi:hypothetical protein